MTEAKKKNPAVVTAKEKSEDGDNTNTFTAPCGARVKINPVSASLINEVSRQILDPDIPTWKNPDKDREEPNPDDPVYLKELAEAESQRATASIDAIVLFGVTLVDGVPEDDSWLGKLKFMQKKGYIDISSYDLEDPMELEFLYKRFVVVDNTILEKITSLSGVKPEDVEVAEASFPGN